MLTVSSKAAKMQNTELYTSDKISSDEIRTLFSEAMSNLYRLEVPQYAELLKIVAEINAVAQPEHGSDRLDIERHGAIRLGTANELHTVRRLFNVMGMFPVSYYDLSVAGIPVHATAFRPISEDALRKNPFRVFTSLLRLDLLSDASLRDQASIILEERMSNKVGYP
jgi:uncharacterized glyoxalase superfamily metalloenzyme YdcJ